LVPGIVPGIEKHRTEDFTTVNKEADFNEKADNGYKSGGEQNSADSAEETVNAEEAKFNAE